MRVDLFKTVDLLSKCAPGALVRDVKDNELGLVVAQHGHMPTTTGCLLQFGGKGDERRVEPFYREFSDPRQVLVYDDRDYWFAIDDETKYGSHLGTSRLLETNGALLLSGSSWFMCFRDRLEWRAYNIASGEIGQRPKLDETVAFAGWKLIRRTIGSDVSSIIVTWRAD
jgi:hypothetical protein